MILEELEARGRADLTAAVGEPAIIALLLAAAVTLLISPMARRQIARLLHRTHALVHYQALIEHHLLRVTAGRRTLRARLEELVLY